MMSLLILEMSLLRATIRHFIGSSMKKTYIYYINEDPKTEEGIIEILGTSPKGIAMVESKIDSITFKPKVGNKYEVKVIKILDFGAVVEYTQAPGNEVLLHVSELAWERTENVTDVVKMGDVLEVKYFGIDSRTRKEKVSRKALFPKPERKD